MKLQHLQDACKHILPYKFSNVLELEFCLSTKPSFSWYLESWGKQRVSQRSLGMRGGLWSLGITKDLVRSLRHRCPGDWLGPGNCTRAPQFWPWLETTGCASTKIPNEQKRERLQKQVPSCSFTLVGPSNGSRDTYMADALLAPSLLCWCSSCWSCCCSYCLEDLVEESLKHIQNCVWWPGCPDTCRSVLALFKGFLQLQLLFLSIDLAPAATSWGVGMVKSLEILRFLYPQVCSVPCPSINDFSIV